MQHMSCTLTEKEANRRLSRAAAPRWRIWRGTTGQKCRSYPRRINFSATAKELYFQAMKNMDQVKLYGIYFKHMCSHCFYFAPQCSMAMVTEHNYNYKSLRDFLWLFTHGKISVFYCRDAGWGNRLKIARGSFLSKLKLTAPHYNVSYNRHSNLYRRTRIRPTACSVFGTPQCYFADHCHCYWSQLWVWRTAKEFQLCFQWLQYVLLRNICFCVFFICLV